MCVFFFFNDTATTEIYTLSLHDALPISSAKVVPPLLEKPQPLNWSLLPRSEEHTSELQSHSDLVCRLLLEKNNRLAPTLDPATHPARSAIVRAWLPGGRT